MSLDQIPADPGPHIVHVIDGIDVGGAEWVLVQLVEGLQRVNYQNTVLALTTCGSLADRLIASGATVTALGMRRGRLPGISVAKLVAAVRSAKPDVIQSWMYHGNVAADLARSLARSQAALAWSVHNSLAPMPPMKAVTLGAFHACRLRSGRPDAIIYVSESSARQHEALGFRSDRTKVICNGTDTERFCPKPPMPDVLRRLCDAPPDTPLVGLIARWDPMKGHRILCAAAGRLIASGQPLHLVFAGTGASPDNQALQEAIRSAGLLGRISLLGERGDVDQIIAGLDLLVLPSVWGESFPLVLGEAMASGVPCIASDVGDCRLILGDTGRIVPPGDVSALEAAMRDVLTSTPAQRRSQGQCSRGRIERKFSADRMVNAYRDLYQDLAAHAGVRPKVES